MALATFLLKKLLLTGLGHNGYNNILPNKLSTLGYVLMATATFLLNKLLLSRLDYNAKATICQISFQHWATATFLLNKLLLTGAGYNNSYSNNLPNKLSTLGCAIMAIATFLLNTEAVFTGLCPIAIATIYRISFQLRACQKE
jgi:hypothetical protein